MLRIFPRMFVTLVERFKYDTPIYYRLSGDVGELVLIFLKSRYRAKYKEVRYCSATTRWVERFLRKAKSQKLPLKRVAAMAEILRDHRLDLEESRFLRALQ